MILKKSTSFESHVNVSKVKPSITQYHQENLWEVDITPRPGVSGSCRKDARCIAALDRDTETLD
jgi:hypothetical protein